MVVCYSYLLTTFLQAILVRYSSHTTIRCNRFVSKKNFTTATSRKTEWIITDYCLLCLVVLQYETFSLTNVLKDSIATACICAFSYLSVPYACCYWFRCSKYVLVYWDTLTLLRLLTVHLRYPSHIHTDVGLLINSSMC